MAIAFEKMHGNGNDFVLLDNRAGLLPLDPARVQRIADRRHGVGCDQVLVAEAPSNGAAPVAMRVFNSDGGEAEQCGNGLRCFAAYARALGMAIGDAFDIQTAAGTVHAELRADGHVRVSMGKPGLEPADVPLLAPAFAPRYRLDVEGEVVEVGAVSMGNPHAVLRVDRAESAPVERLGPAIQALSEFPNGVNVGFMEIVSPRHLRLRVYERGAGETLACGTGACAAVVVGGLQDSLGTHVMVSLPGGDLQVEWLGRGHPVYLSGPTARVFRGEMEL